MGRKCYKTCEQCGAQVPENNRRELKNWIHIRCAGLAIEARGTTYHHERPIRQDFCSIKCLKKHFADCVDDLEEGEALVGILFKRRMREWQNMQGGQNEQRP